MILTLNINEIDIAYRAVQNAPHTATIAPDILTVLDVEEYKPSYDLEFENAEFENIRLAVSHFEKTQLDINIKKQAQLLLDKLNEIRTTLI